MALVRAYQYVLSPWLGNHCRFHPSCSHYAHTALERFGAWRGCVLALRRLARCHPWSPGGVDPVPPVLPTAEPAAEPQPDRQRHG